MIARTAFTTLLAFTLSCASTAHEGPPQLQAASPPTASGDAGPGTTADPSMPERSLTTLTEQGPTLAAGMRALEGGEFSISHELTRDLIAPSDKDTCVRLTFSASTSIVAKLVDASNRVLTESTPSKDATLGQRGPVCVRRGEPIRVQFTAISPATVRFAAWASP